ncbi:uncharacterized protein TNCV_1894101 [Trichonephila clavipes]|nr:uncharacterized protein TNCV_1894101 [Trichonephila clavipes]
MRIVAINNTRALDDESTNFEHRSNDEDDTSWQFLFQTTTLKAAYSASTDLTCIDPLYLPKRRARSKEPELWPDLEGEKDFNDDQREEITDLVQSIPGFQECDEEDAETWMACDEEDAETWMACDAEDCGFQILNDDEIVTSVQKEYDPVDDETDEDEDNSSNKSSKGPSNADGFSALKTAME